MGLLDIILLAIALAMDCFTVSIVSGVILGRREWRIILQMSFLFGLFQAFMPLLGWTGMSILSDFIMDYGRVIAFIMLAFIGGKMIYESFGASEEHAFNPRKLVTQLLLAVATSIDAMAVGVSFSAIGYNHVSSLWGPLAWIGFFSLFFGIAGHLTGLRFGFITSGRIKPELLGGIILVCIGFKILLF
jgi:putative Mn2+ efflux pump MntP